MGVSTVANNLLFLAREVKSRLVKRLNYRSKYVHLHPSDYTRARFRAETMLATKTCRELFEAIGAERLQEFDARYCHPAWVDLKRRFGHSLRKGLPESFLDDPVLRPQMVRRGWTTLQAYEEEYLLSRPPQMAGLLARFKESRVGEPHLECSTYSCSSNSLGHLYYMARILEAFPTLLTRSHAILELGGGYGNFARVYRELIPSAAYVIVDFPELAALQNLFLRLNHVDTVVCRSIEDVVPHPGTVHLLPVQLVPELEPVADVFVSHFALSETARPFQALVAEKRFFGSDSLYLTGQYTGLQPGAAWEPHAPLHHSVRDNYGFVQVEDFPVEWGYELVASKQHLGNALSASSAVGSNAYSPQFAE